MPNLKLSSTPAGRKARLFRNGRNQAVRIPREFELAGDEVMVHREGGRLILEPIPNKQSLTGWLATLRPLKDPFPDVDQNLAPLDDIRV